MICESAGYARHSKWRAYDVIIADQGQTGLLQVEHSVGSWNAIKQFKSPYCLDSEHIPDLNDDLFKLHDTTSETGKSTALSYKNKSDGYYGITLRRSCIGRNDFVLNMMTSSNGNIFRVTGHLCGEFTGYRWILRTKASDAELLCFLWSASE